MLILLRQAVCEVDAHSLVSAIRLQALKLPHSVHGRHTVSACFRVEYQIASTVLDNRKVPGFVSKGSCSRFMVLHLVADALSSSEIASAFPFENCLQRRRSPAPNVCHARMRHSISRRSGLDRSTFSQELRMSPTKTWGRWSATTLEPCTRAKARVILA